LAALFEGINLRGILQEAILMRESLLNGMGCHGRVVAYKNVDIHRRQKVFSSSVCWPAGGVYRSFPGAGTFFRVGDIEEAF